MYTKRINKHWKYDNNNKNYNHKMKKNVIAKQVILMMIQKEKAMKLNQNRKVMKINQIRNLVPLMIFLHLRVTNQIQMMN